MCYTLYRGMKAVTNWVRLKVAATNLKKLVLWKAKASCSFLSGFFDSLVYYTEYILFAYLLRETIFLFCVDTRNNAL